MNEPTIQDRLRLSCNRKHCNCTSAQAAREIDRLQAGMADAIRRAENAEAELKALAEQEPIGFMHDIRKVDIVHVDVKAMLEKFYAEHGFHTQIDRPAMKSNMVEHYNTPVYASPIPAVPAEDAQIFPFVYMKLCPICGNKRCPKAENSAYKCTGSNDVGQVGELERAK